MPVDPVLAQWLQTDADWAVRSSAAQQARWGATARTPETLTGIATRAAAEAEAERQLAFWSRGPFAVDLHELPGTDWADTLGRVVMLTSPELGYDAGAEVFVIGVETDRATGLSVLTVLKPLGAP